MNLSFKPGIANVSGCFVFHDLYPLTMSPAGQSGMESSVGDGLHVSMDLISASCALRAAALRYT